MTTDDRFCTASLLLRGPMATDLGVFCWRNWEGTPKAERYINLFRAKHKNGDGRGSERRQEMGGGSQRTRRQSMIHEEQQTDAKFRNSVSFSLDNYSTGSDKIARIFCGHLQKKSVSDSSPVAIFLRC